MEPFRRELMNIVQALQGGAPLSGGTVPDGQAVVQPRQTVPVGRAQSEAESNAVNNDGSGQGAGTDALGTAAWHFVDALADQMGAAGAGSKQHTDEELQRLVGVLADMLKAGPSGAGAPGGGQGDVDADGVDGAGQTEPGAGPASGDGSGNPGGVGGAGEPETDALADAARHLIDALHQQLGGPGVAGAPPQPDGVAPGSGGDPTADVLAQLVRALQKELQARPDAHGDAPPDTGEVSQRLAQALQPGGTGRSGGAPGRRRLL